MNNLSLTIPNIEKILELAIKVSNHYKEVNSNSLEIALKGTIVGLKRYSDRVSRGDELPKIELYLTWYMKTAIEYELGYRNEDTKAWKWID